ncbi:phosphorylcholine transferase LicD [Anaerovibrio lipolyticus]|uniref:LicD family protein n=1 Tax=Anaerovibrio lipolyticus TaxID=82374 RepID=UPI0026F30ED2|nr:LicD family protein [Anaerovibrio lipolyticus]
MSSFILDNKHNKKLQGEILSLLVEFDRICRKHDIKYYLACGTLLGAVRHKGFIPWDNDGDVELMREDYNKLVEVCQKEENDRFFFQDWSTDKEYRWPYGKLRIKNTSYIRPFQAGMKHKDGICIDVFVLDNLPESYVVQKMMEFGAMICRKIGWSPVGATCVRNPFQRALFKVASKIPYEIITKLYTKIVGWCHNSKSTAVGFFNTGMGNVDEFIFQRSWYEESVELDFEGYKFWAPKGYDGILRNKYHDYMQLPPKEKQVGSSEAEFIRFSDGEEIDFTRDNRRKVL